MAKTGAVSAFFSAVIGAAGVNRVGAEGEIFSRTIGYSLILTAAVGIVAMIEVYLVLGIIPRLS